MKKSIGGSMAVFCLLMLLARPSLALEGARQGLLLWADVVLPTLLPFMICSGMIVALDGIGILTRPFFPVLSGLMGLSDQGSYVFMSGLLCGYPMGAKTASDFADCGRIRPEEGRFLLAISNHPSPMFVLGYVMNQLRLAAGARASISIWAVILCLYLPILPLTLLAKHLYLSPRRQKNGKSQTPDSHPSPRTEPFSFNRHMMSCFETMVVIGGYIMLFSILALYLRWLPFPSHTPRLFLPALLGLVEITTGIQAIASGVSGPAALMLILASAAFGGISGVFQTKSVLKNAGLSIRHYVLWKLLHSLLSCLLCCILMMR